MASALIASVVSNWCIEVSLIPSSTEIPLLFHPHPLRFICYETSNCLVAMPSALGHSVCLVETLIRLRPLWIYFKPPTGCNDHSIIISHLYCSSSWLDGLFCNCRRASSLSHGAPTHYIRAVHPWLVEGPKLINGHTFYY